MKSTIRYITALSVVLLFAAFGHAQTPIVGSATPVPLSLTGVESLTVSCVPGAGVTFAAAPGTTVAGNAPISCTTAWNLHSTRTSLTLYAGLSTAATALTDGTNVIPASALSASFNSGASNPCTGTANAAATLIGAGAACGSAGSGNLLSNNFNSQVTTTISLSLTEPATLSANTYSGNLIVQVVGI